MTRHTRTIRLFIASLLIIGVPVIRSHATTLVRMDLNALARSAEIIVRARCVQSEMKWESESIWTFDNFEVLEVFKGVPPQILRIRLPGGRVNHTEVKVEGAPTFSPGEEMVLFLERTSAGDYGVTGWAQGTFRIRREANGETRASQDTSHVAVFDLRTRQFAPVGVRNLPMAEFRAQLMRALIGANETTQAPGGKKL